MATRLMHKPLFATVFCALVLLTPSLGSVNASPRAVQEVPPGVGLYEEEANPCLPTSVIFGVIGTAVGAAVGSLVPIVGTGAGAVGGTGVGAGIGYYLEQGCNEEVAEKYAKVERAFHDAYLEAEAFPASPGYPVGGIHEWVGFQIQDFSGGTDSSGNLDGDGWGAIIWGGDQADVLPHFVGGGHWVSYKAAVYELDIVPGYPINAQHQLNGVIIQDFRGGSWGDAAIIGGDNAWLVAGRHWEAYKAVNGSARLGNPTGPWHQAENGLYVQEFEGGEIGELDHEVTVIYYDGSPADHLYVD